MEAKPTCCIWYP
jgi:WD40 repeat protein